MEQFGERGLIPIVFEDEHFVAVDKPSGMFVHRSDADRSATEFVLQTVRDQIGQFLYPVHRLDRPTSGVLLLAKNRETAALLSGMFANRQIRKTYQAVVRGYTDDDGVVNRPLDCVKRCSPGGLRESVVQEARTEWRTIERYEVPFSSGRHSTTRCSLLEVCPCTGRNHQIRRHLAGISHPILGDSEHGDTKFNRRCQLPLRVTRLMLASVSVEFLHPVTQHAIQIACEPGGSFATVVQELRKQAAASGGNRPEVC